MKLRPEEITSILKRRIEEYDVETDLAEVGSVLEVGDGIARVYGLENAVSLEMLEFEHGVTGLALNLEEDNVGTALFGEWEHVKEGEVVKRTGRVTSIPVGEALIGRIVNPLGQPLDGQGPIETTERRPAEHADASKHGLLDAHEPAGARHGVQRFFEPQPSLRKQIGRRLLRWRERHSLLECLYRCKLLLTPLAGR